MYFGFFESPGADLPAKFLDSKELLGEVYARFNRDRSAISAMEPRHPNNWYLAVSS